MPLELACPQCGKRLKAPDSLVGRPVECSGCKHRFRVPVQNPASPPQAESGRNPAARAAASATQKTVFPSAPPASPSPSGPGEGRPSTPGAGAAGDRGTYGHTSMAQPPAPSLENMKDPAPARRPSPGLETTSFAAPPGGNSPPSAETPPPHSAPPQGNSAARTPASTAVPHTPARQANRARFVAADTTKSQIHLGSDGTLPELHLDRIEQQQKGQQQQEKSANPLVLAVALAVSFSLTLLMLLVDPSGSGVDTGSKDYARQQVQAHYLSTRPPLKDYEQMLRKALQAHAQGKLALEKDYYRRVLDMLNAEDKNEYKGLTGVPDATHPPNDRHLQQQLTILVAD